MALKLIGFSPANGETASVGTDIILTFSEPVFPGAGKIQFWTWGKITMFHELTLPSGHVFIDGNTLRIDLGFDLAPGGEYFITVDPGVVVDAAGAKSPLIYQPAIFKTSIGYVPVTLTGTERPDDLMGSNANDNINGGGGIDWIDGKGGNDIINGGDEIGAGDWLSGGDGIDYLHGNLGDDDLRGGDDNDQLFGDGGNDHLDGGDGDDLLEGGDGNDILVDRWGRNILRGGAGNDELTVSNTKSTLDGGDGNDILRGNGVDTFVGGAGNDQVVIGVYTEASATASGGSGNDVFEVNFRTFGGTVKVAGGAGSDTFVLDTGSPSSGFQYVIEDFDAMSGDVLDLHTVLAGYAGSNRFGENGFVRLLQSGADTLVQERTPSGSYYTLAKLLGVSPSELGTANYTGGQGPVVPATKGISLNGTSADDVLKGGAGDDGLNGSVGNDQFVGNGGNDTFWGGDGVDTALYGGVRGDYTVSFSQGLVRVRAKVGSDGVDTLSAVERVQFADGALALDTNGGAGQIYRLYAAAFDRTPDVAGIGYWLKQVDHGTSLHSIAQGFIASNEFVALYGAAPTNAQLVERFYLNVLDRKPDAGGTAFWIDVLDRHAGTVADVLEGFSESLENQTVVANLIGEGFPYLPYAG